LLEGEESEALFRVFPFKIICYAFPPPFGIFIGIDLHKIFDNECHIISNARGGSRSLARSSTRPWSARSPACVKIPRRPEARRMGGDPSHKTRHDTSIPPSFLFMVLGDQSLWVLRVSVCPPEGRHEDGLFNRSPGGGQAQPGLAEPPHPPHLPEMVEKDPYRTFANSWWSAGASFWSFRREDPGLDK